MLEEKYESLKKEENLRELLSLLRTEAKDEENRRKLQEIAGDGNVLCGLLTNEDAKVRKSAALLIGTLEIEQAVDALLAAYQSETTLFVKSAYLTALGKLDAGEHLEYFKQRYQMLVKQPVALEEKKHIHEEIKALLESILSIEPVKKHTFTGFLDPHEMLLATNREQREVTLGEVSELSATIRRSAELSPLGVKVYAKEVIPFTKLRTYRELLFPLAVKEPVAEKPEIAAELLWNSGMLEFLKKLGTVLEEKSDWQLINAPKGYEVEIRLLQRKEGGYLPFLKLFTLPMTRFSYRRNAVATSLHPATAAMLVRLAKPYLKENAQILDPCCGVGTMMIERDICVPARE